MKQKTTINDVAAHCGVSKSSVSRYLNKGYVSKENAIKIAKAIEELNFETNFFASRLKSKHSHLLGVLVATLEDEGCAKIINGMQETWNAYGYQGVILLSNHELEKEKHAIQSFAQQGVDGIVLLECNHVEELEATIMKYEIPVLYANRRCTYAPFLDINETQAGTIMGEYLAKHHLQKITYLQHDKEIGEKRKNAIVAAFEKYNRPCDFDVVKIDETYEDAYNACTKVIGKQRECILCERDEYALSVLKCCHEYHIHVPQNVSVASFGGRSITSLCSPMITCLAVDYPSYGKNLVEEICAIIETRSPNWTEVKLEILERESVKSAE